MEKNYYKQNINYDSVISNLYFLEKKDNEYIELKIQDIHKYENLNYYYDHGYNHNNNSRKVKFLKLVEKNIQALNYDFFKNFKKNYLDFLNKNLNDKSYKFLDFYPEPFQHKIITIQENESNYLDSNNNCFDKKLLTRFGLYKWVVSEQPYKLTTLFKSLKDSKANHNCLNLINCNSNYFCLNSKNLYDCKYLNLEIQKSFNKIHNNGLDLDYAFFENREELFKVTLNMLVKQEEELLNENIN